MSRLKIAISEKQHFNKTVGNSTTKDYFIKVCNYTKIAEYLKNGHAITNIFDKDGQFHRAKKNFVSADFFALDIDNCPEKIKENEYTYFSWNELVDGETDRAKFILTNAFLIYTTQSHSEQQNRFRILFHLPERIKDVNEFERITYAFHSKFPEADPSCKEAARYFYGSGKDGKMETLDNRLTNKIIDEMLDKFKSNKTPNQINIKKPLTENFEIENNANKIIEYLFSYLKEAKVGERNNTLNEFSFLISSYTNNTDKKRVNCSDKELKNHLRTIASDIGLDTEEINKTIESGWNAGRKLDLDISTYDDANIKRTHANKQIEGMLQVPKKILHRTPNTQNVSKKTIDDAIKTNTGNFKDFQIEFKEEINRELIIKTLKKIDNPKYLKCYLSLWKYAHKIGSVEFDHINLNDIIQYSEDPANLYRKRKEYVEMFKILGLTSIVLEKKSEDEEIKKDFLIVHLINELEVKSEKGKTYISCKLPKENGDIGDYLPDSIFQISTKNKGAFFLTVELYKEINRRCLSKKVNGKYQKPEFNKKAIKWKRKRLVKYCTLERTNEANKSKANEYLAKILNNLKSNKIISRFSPIPLNDEEKISIGIPNP